MATENNVGAKNYDVLGAIERLRKKLLDLSRRNPLVNFKATSNSVQIFDELPNQVFDTLVQKSKAMVFEPLPEVDFNLEGIDSKDFQEQKKKIAATKALVDLNGELPKTVSQSLSRKHTDQKLQTDLFPEQLEAKLHKNLLRSRSFIEETGINQLYLNIGYLEWYDSVDSSVQNRSPLYLVPVELSRLEKLDAKHGIFRHQIEYTGEDIYTNITLQEKLVQDFGIKIPDIISGDGESFLTPEEYFEKIEELIQAKKGWKIRRHIYLSFVTFSKILMYLDLDPTKNEELICQHGILNDILLGIESENQSCDIMDEADFDEKQAITIPMVLDADSSQQSAIHDVICGKSLVIEGPPGTGKSQTITNLIAASIGSGKKVLFVAEKLAALNVVKKHLDRIGLGDFCFELHSNKISKKEVLNNLNNRIKLKTSSVKDLTAVRGACLKTIELLNEYSGLLHRKVEGFDDSLYDLIGFCHTLADGEAQDLTNQVSFKKISNKTKLNHSVSLLREYVDTASTISSEAKNYWKGFFAAKYLPTDEQNVRLLFEAFSKNVELIYNECIVLLSSIQFDHTIITNEDVLNVVRLKDLDFEIVGENITDDWLSVCASYPEGLQESLKSALGDMKNALELYLANQYIIKNYDGIVQKRAVLKEQVDQLLIIDSAPIQDLEAISKNIVQAIDCLQFLQQVKFQLQNIGITNIKNFSDLERICPIFNLLKDVSRFRKFILSSDSLEKSNLQAFEISLKEYQDYQKIKTEIDKFFIFPEQFEDKIQGLYTALQKYANKSLRWFYQDYRLIKNQVCSMLVPERKYNLSSCLKNFEQMLQGLELKREAEQTKEINFFIDGPLENVDISLALEFVKWANNFVPFFENRFIAVASISQLSSGFPQFFEGVRENLEQAKYIVRSLFLYSSSEDSELNKVEIEKHTLNSLLERLVRLKNGVQNFLQSGCGDFLNSGVTVKALAKLLGDVATIENYLGKYNSNSLIKAFGVQNKTVYEPSFGQTIQCLGDMLIFLEHVYKEKISLQLISKIGIFCLKSNKNLFDKLSQFFLKLSAAKKQFQTDCENIAVIDGNVFFRDAHHGHVTLNSIYLKTKTYGLYLNQLAVWAQLCRSVNKLADADLSELVSTKIDPNILPKSYEYSAIKSLVKDCIKKSEMLIDFNRLKHERLRADFQQADHALKKVSVEEIACHCNSKRPPRGISRGAVKEWTEMGLIQREIEKQRQHIPVRSLVGRAKESLLTLKPCFMMSPISVAQYLPLGEIEFDLMIIDEASQIRSHDALGAILRSKQIVVVGDSNQLPPTSFFDRADVNEEQEDEALAVDESESILDACSMAQFSKRRLKWHYRSRHESLIAYSNSQFYDNDLIIFPSKSNGSDLGIQYHFVENGCFVGRRNLEEAQKVVELVVEHAVNRPHKSIGVVAFNINQSNLIDELIEKERKRDGRIDLAISELERRENGEGFFVKNLENVQGDERDVIVISATYGKDKESGKVFQRFGPINGSDGWKRLNVICTRAKEKMVVVSSMRHSDILTSQDNRGALALKNFLKYAESGILPEAVTVTGKSPDSPFEQAVGRVLMQHGFDIRYQVGVAGYFIDIGVLHPSNPSEFILAVECDGATYHSAKSARDRDRLREEVLRSRGWDIHRIWSTDWFFNQEQEVSRLVSRIKQMV